MFRFQNPYYFYLFLLLLLIVLIFEWSRYAMRRNLRRFGDVDMLGQLMPDVSYVRPRLKFYLVILALSLVIFALARPQFGVKQESVKTRGVEAMFVLDVSNSMMATDVAPSRLENSKMIISKLIDYMPDDKVGLIVFAGQPFIQLPITSDNVSAKMFLSSITTGSVPNQGTAIGSAIDMAIKSFGVSESNAGRTIILITDGENHEDNAVAVAQLAREKGITVNVVGVGSPQGSPIAIQGTTSFWKDRDGNVVVSKLNEEMCHEVAKAGGGVYVRADNSNIALRTLIDSIDKMQKGEFEAKAFTSYDEKFYIFAWIALFLLMIEFTVLIRQNHKLNRIKWFD